MYTPYTRHSHAIYMEDSCQGQIETGSHFFDVCVAVDVAHFLNSGIEIVSHRTCETSDFARKYKIMDFREE